MNGAPDRCACGRIGDITLGCARRLGKRRAEERQIDDRVLVALLEPCADGAIVPCHPLGPDRLSLSQRPAPELRRQQVRAQRLEDRLCRWIGMTDRDCLFYVIPTAVDAPARSRAAPGVRNVRDERIGRAYSEHVTVARRFSSRRFCGVDHTTPHFRCPTGYTRLDAAKRALPGQRWSPLRMRSAHLSWR